MTTLRDDFRRPDIEALAKRAAYICSNPDCRAQAIGPSAEDDSKYIFIGKAAHITAAAPGGPRFDPSLTSEQRRSINNGIFLCSSCADMIDKNLGVDYPTELLLNWKQDHEAWVAENLNKRGDQEQGPGLVINVTSHDQRGGITAGVVNIGSQSRNLAPKLQNQLLEALPNKEGDVTITSTLGDGEAFRFATQIMDFLAGKGYSVKGVNRAIFSRPLQGQTIDPDTRTIRIGTNE